MKFEGSEMLCNLPVSIYRGGIHMLPAWKQYVDKVWGKIELCHRADLSLLSSRTMKYFTLAVDASPDR